MSHSLSLGWLNVFPGIQLPLTLVALHHLKFCCQFNGCTVSSQVFYFCSMGWLHVLLPLTYVVPHAPRFYIVFHLIGSELSHCWLLWWLHVDPGAIADIPVLLLWWSCVILDVTLLLIGETMHHFKHITPTHLGGSAFSQVLYCCLIEWLHVIPLTASNCVRSESFLSHCHSLSWIWVILVISQ